MRVLGVDPGLTRCGSAWSTARPGRPLPLVHVEVLRTPADADLGRPAARARPPASTPPIAAHRPDVVAVERVFSQHNVRTVMGTAQAAAVAMVAAARAGIPVALHTPSEVKAAVTGSGRADKAQVGAHGDPAAAAARARPDAGRRRRRAGAGDLPALARRAPAGAALAAAAAGAGEARR